MLRRLPGGKLWSVAVLGLVVVGLTGVSTSASAAAPLVLQLRFHRVSVPNREKVLQLQTSGDYALLTLADGTRVVINDRTNARRAILHGSGCRVEDMADPWILFGFCGHRHLYNLRTGSSVPLTGDLSTAIFTSGGHVLGSHWLWIQYPEGCGGGGMPGCSQPAFFSIPSGAENVWQPHGNVYGNVNSASLTQHVCWPVGDPSPLGIIGPFSSFEAPEPSSLVWGNKFTVTATASSDGSSATEELEGCGGNPTMTMFTTTNDGPPSWIDANTHAVTWWLGPTGSTVDGIFIPSLTRFQAQLPVQLSRGLITTTPKPLWLTTGHMWVLGPSGGVWKANFPTGP